MKTLIRHNLLQERNGLTEQKVMAASKSAAKLLMDSEYIRPVQGKSVMLYASFKNEMSTWDLIHSLFSEGIKVILPKTSGNDLVPYEYNGMDSLQTDSFGILSPNPAKCQPAELSKIQTVIVPGVGFDKKGNRMGFGKGYYDRFLPSIPHALKIGLCYEFQIKPSIPVEETDIPMDLLLTENGFINCKKYNCIAR